MYHDISGRKRKASVMVASGAGHGKVMKAATTVGGRNSECEESANGNNLCHLKYISKLRSTSRNWH